MKLRLCILALVSFAFVSLAGCVGGPSCGVTTGGSGTPSLVFTQVPPLGRTESLQGQELHVAPVDYYIAVYIHVGSEGWWIKPTFSDPETTINCDGGLDWPISRPEVMTRRQTRSLRSCCPNAIPHHNSAGRRLYLRRSTQSLWQT